MYVIIQIDRYGTMVWSCNANSEDVEGILEDEKESLDKGEMVIAVSLGGWVEGRDEKTIFLDLPELGT